MRKKLVRYSILICLLSLIMTSCAQRVWVKNNADEGELAQVKYRCLQEAQQDYQSAYKDQFGNAGAVSKIKTNDQLFESCMKAEGWILKNKEIAQAQIQAQAEQNQKLNEEMKREFSEYRMKYKRNCLKQDYAEYYAKTACFVQDITFAQIADETKITEAQKKSLLSQSESVLELRKYNNELQLRYRGEQGKKRVQVERNYLEPKEEANNLDLYNGKITWGVYNKNRKDIQFELENRMRDIR